MSREQERQELHKTIWGIANDHSEGTTGHQIFGAEGTGGLSSPLWVWELKLGPLGEY